MSKTIAVQIPGGLYPWQRVLWEAVAASKGCEYSVEFGSAKGEKFNHVLTGASAAIEDVKRLATEYQVKVEGHTRNWAKAAGISGSSHSAHMFRDGAVNQLAARLRAGLNTTPFDAGARSARRIRVGKIKIAA